MKLYDKHLIPIERGDIVKIYHFTDYNRKKQYMYKQCLGYFDGRAMFSHLNFIIDPNEQDGPYTEYADNRAISSYEIVQSIQCDHEDRIRKRN